MIPSKVALTFCQLCEEQIGSRFSPQNTGTCSMGCVWDGSTSRDRPIIVVTYWRREGQAAQPYTRPEEPRPHASFYDKIGGP